MKKRLRKKLHLGEFQEFGFDVACRFVKNLSDDQIDRFIDTFIIEAIENNGLCCGGGGDKNEWSVFVTRDGRDSVTESHREKVASWLKSNEFVAEFEVGDLMDAWYGKE